MSDQEQTSSAGEWTPAFPGQRPPFQPGNTLGFTEGNQLSLRHGAYSPRKVHPLAAEIVEALLADETVPAYAKATAYRLELWELARAEARYQLVDEWLTAQAEGRDDGMPDLSSEAVRSAFLIQHRAATRAASARSRLGLTPAAAARLGKDVAVGRAAEADVAQRMALMAQMENELEARGWQRPTDDHASGEEGESHELDDE